MKTGNEKATAGTVAQVKAQAQTKTLAEIIAEVAPIVKRRWPNLDGRLTRAIEIASDAYGVIATATPNTWWVRSQRPEQGNQREWYRTEELTACECRDCQNGHLCKHLVAVELTRLAKVRGNGSAPRPREEWECNCVLPSQSCPACEAAAREVYGEVL